MTSDHVIFIPAVLMIGFVAGFVIGRKTLLSQIQARREALRRRKARRAAKGTPESTTAPSAAVADTSSS